MRLEEVLSDHRDLEHEDLLAMFDVHVPAVVTALQEADFVERGPDVLAQHRRR